MHGRGVRTRPWVVLFKQDTPFSFSRWLSLVHKHTLPLFTSLLPSSTASPQPTPWGRETLWLSRGAGRIPRPPSPHWKGILTKASLHLCWLKNVYFTFFPSLFLTKEYILCSLPISGPVQRPGHQRRPLCGWGFSFVSLLRYLCLICGGRHMLTSCPCARIHPRSPRSCPSCGVRLKFSIDFIFIFW